MREKDFQAKIMQVARWAGWLVYHTYDSRRSEPGFPDLTMTRPGRLVFAELKVKKRKLTKEQARWIETLASNPGVEAYIWRPEDWDALVTVLTKTNYSERSRTCTPRFVKDSLASARI